MPATDADIRRLVDDAELWTPPATLDEPRERKRRSKGDKPEPILEPYCDLALTRAFSDKHADDLRYCDIFGSWLVWDGGRWREDVTRSVIELAGNHCAAKSIEARARIARDGTETERVAARVASQVASAKTVRAIADLARADRRHATRADDWDADPWALNTPGGTVNLRTGRVHPHDRGALHSKITAVAPAPAGTPCPLWTRFLDRVTAGDDDLQRYLRRLFGYCLTGSTREHVMAFFYGTGKNGKGTCLNTLAAIFGDYAKIAPMETFTESLSDRHPTELAMLRGARLVAAQETEEGRRWAESKVKALTGGDPISARFMRQDFFTFQPQFKLVIAGNHKPGLRNIDEAIKRRFHLVPFTVEIPEAERDLDLPEKLKSEWGAILQWAVEGCVEWQRAGLQPPAAVIAATDEYFGDADALGNWLAECTTRDSMAHERTRDLYAAWKTWAERAGLSAGTEPKFAQTLKDRGTQPWRDKHGRGFAGIALLRHDYTDDGRYGG